MKLKRKIYINKQDYKMIYKVQKIIKIYKNFLFKNHFKIFQITKIKQLIKAMI